MALYVVAVMVTTSYMRIRLGRHLWKAFHFSIYVGAVALFWHSLLTDPSLKPSPIDWLDGGKVFVESCTAITVVTAGLRYRRARQRAAQVKEKTRETVASTLS